ncbi:MAG: formylglycine-generating enzyme family protein [Pirellulaceae bacterium]
MLDLLKKYFRSRWPKRAGNHVIRTLETGGEWTVAPADGTGETAATVSDAPRSPSVDPFQQMLEQGRCALLLRPQIAENLDESQVRQAQEAFDTMASRTPAGPVILQGWRRGELEALNDARTGPCRVLVDELFLDRYAVTNGQFLAFVAAGGYAQETLWNPSAWQRVNEFVDRGDLPGPRGWHSGTFAEGEADHPVVGVCWYEADAYARWAGKRLPADAEWVKAASWPVVAEDGGLVERKYPWGDTPAPQKANLWNRAKRGTLPVADLPAGASAGGAIQLIGNVWEWTSSSLQIVSERGRVRLDRPLKIIRGGAYDTYFENQITCQFQSADSSFARRHNIGFRCAISACDIGGLLSVQREPGQALGESTVSQEISV